MYTEIFCIIQYIRTQNNQSIITAMEQELLLLLRAPKKKYIKKLLEYAMAISHPSTMSSFLSTPIAQQCQSDLGLSTQQTNTLFCALVRLIDTAIANNFQLDMLWKTDFDESLKDCLNQLLISLKEDIKSIRRNQNNTVIDIQWSVEYEIQQELCNKPIVRLQIASNLDSCLQKNRIQCTQKIFGQFYNQLVNIKEEIKKINQRQDK